MYQKRKKRFVIGVTGGIATGKSSVLKEFAKRRIPTISSDELAHQCLNPRHPCFRSVVRHFGPGILNTHQQIDRAALGAIVFTNYRERKWLEHCIHPHVVKGLRSFIRRHRGLIVLDIPLLFEARLQRLVDRILVVWSPYSEQLKRLQLRNGLTSKETQQRIRAQWPLSYKKKRADYLVNNASSKSTMRHQMSDLIKKLKKEAVSKNT